MISLGTNIRDTSCCLSKVPVRQLYDTLRNPSANMKARMRQLRIVRQLSPAQYATLKRELPYFVCGIFSPPCRKTENFAYTEYFVIDIDHVSEGGRTVAELKRHICADSRVALCFVSPGGDGLKVVMKLKERCYDAEVYKIFYKQFVDKFSSSYNLGQVVDSRTCDAARACFLSEDTDAYYNPEPEKVDMSLFISPENDAQLAFDIKREADKALKEADKMVKAKVGSSDPERAVMERIKATLNPKSCARSQKPPAYVPAELEAIMSSLKQYVEERDVVLADVINIQYGKKLRFRIGTKAAEINLFFGKRGFSVVQSPRTGTDAGANALMAEVIESFLSENT